MTDMDNTLPNGETEDNLDPRIKAELDQLNASTDEINKLENELDEARAQFRQTSSTFTQKLNLFAQKNKRTVRKARPYYEAVKEASEAQIEAQQAARKFQQAVGVHKAAKETIQLAEERLLSDAEKCFDTAWQEMLNHATTKVMEAEREKSRSEIEHRLKSEKFSEACDKVNLLSKKLKRTISKSKPYFELRAECSLKLQQQKQNVVDLQKAVINAKKKYANSLKLLEQISDEIHHSREFKLPDGPRGVGVGAESDESSLEINFDIGSSCGTNDDDVESEQFDDVDDVSSTGDDLDVFAASATETMENMNIHDDTAEEDVAPRRGRCTLERHVSGRSESDLNFCEDYYLDRAKHQSDRSIVDDLPVDSEDDDIDHVKSSALNIPRAKVKISAEGLSITPTCDSYLTDKEDILNACPETAI
ncbi:SH3 domain-binding protein 5-like [Ptychodera flava]|uniref:SH3 domain-binding protein 5-like n=1 Tax=Ptychodera flava TaxID=63121 RepID=UPI003969FBE4